MSETRSASTLGVEDVARAIGAARPSLDPEEERLALALYRLLAEGKPVSVTALADHLDRPHEAVDRSLDSWPGVFRDHAQRVVGFHGLALRETAHRFRVVSRDLYAWCAWDTLFLPQLIGSSAQVQSRCPVTGETVRLTVSPERVEKVAPFGVVVSMLLPREDFSDDVVTSFCHFIHFFSSPAAAESWTRPHPDTFVLSVERAFELGQRANRLNFPTALG